MKKLIEKLKKPFEKKPDYKELYEQQKRVAESWEFKYNTLRRKIEDAIK